jgi:superfamily II DNA/RNA helicase
VLLDQLRTIREGEPNANILVYTEYTDSQDAILEFLRSSRDNGKLSGAVEAISGRDGESDRAKITERLGEKDSIVLVSTDATAEGLNLHQRCHHLIHLELPYNPNRLEQRNGRIDRYGQERTPLVRYLYLAGTFEERLLLRLVWKYEKQRARMTFMPNTLGVLTDEHAQMTTSLLAGLAEEQELLFKRPRLKLQSLNQDEDDAGVGSPLELRFLRLFESQGFDVEKQVPISANDSEAPVSIADFVLKGTRTAIYVDGAAFHQGKYLRRDRFIRDRLRQGNLGWQVVELEHVRVGQNQHLQFGNNGAAPTMRSPPSRRPPVVRVAAVVKLLNVKLL